MNDRFDPTRQRATSSPPGGAGPAFLQPVDVLAGEATSSDGQLATHGATRLEELEEKLEVKFPNVVVLDGAWTRRLSYSLCLRVALHCR